MKIWPFAQLNEWADHKRRSREVRVVATWQATTNFINEDGTKTGRTETHIVELKMDGQRPAVLLGVHDL